MKQCCRACIRHLGPNYTRWCISGGGGGGAAAAGGGAGAAGVWFWWWWWLIGVDSCRP